MHTFDPRMIERMMMRTSNGVLVKMVQTVIMTTIVQFSCNLLFPPHCGTLGNRLQEARFPSGKADSRSNFPFPHQPATSGRPQMRPQFTSPGPKFPGSRSQFPIPGCGSQALATPVATPIKTVAAEGVRNVMNPATSPEIQPGAILDY